MLTFYRNDENQVAFDDVPSSAQPKSRIPNGAKKARMPRNNKKGKKTYRGAAWPPQPRGPLLSAPTEPAGLIQTSDLPTEHVQIHESQGNTPGADKDHICPAALQGEGHTHASVLAHCGDKVEAGPSLMETDRSPSTARATQGMGNMLPHQIPDHAAVHPLNPGAETTPVPVDPDALVYALQHLDRLEPENVPSQLENDPRHNAPRPKPRRRQMQQAHRDFDQNVAANEPEAHWVHDAPQMQHGRVQHPQHAADEYVEVNEPEAHWSHGVATIRNDHAHQVQHAVDERVETTEPEARWTGDPPQQGSVQQTQAVADEHVEADQSEAYGANGLHSPVQRRAHPYSQALALPRDDHGRGGPYRVEKPTKRKRTVSGPQVLSAYTNARSCAPAVKSGFEHIFDSLHTAYLAEKSQKDHDLATKVEHFKELKTQLQAQIKQQETTINEWKDRHDGLDSRVGQMREKAKTNQKYVTGLQKDYEKLQKSVATFQEECKKTLRQAIAEVEIEKNDLRRDFETTLNTVSKSQKNLKQTIDDLYVRLIISESKRKDLAENMSKQVAMYEEEKSKRNDIEKQLLSSVQSVQRQLGDHSTQFVEKLESLQALVESGQTEDRPDSSAHKCLVVLKQLQSIPFITTKDLGKVASMLRFVHEG